MHRKPMILVYAGPNGSGKSSITSYFSITGKYINADDIKRTTFCSDMQAALKAEELREDCVRNLEDFTFETVLSTERNIQLLRKAKQRGFFIKSVFVLTASPETNIIRVAARVVSGGHNVPADKIISRYWKSLNNLPELVRLSDVCHVYDNTETPTRIFKKKKYEEIVFPNDLWGASDITRLVSGIPEQKQHVKNFHFM